MYSFIADACAVEFVDDLADDFAVPVCMTIAITFVDAVSFARFRVCYARFQVFPCRVSCLTSRVNENNLCESRVGLAFGDDFIVFFSLAVFFFSIFVFV